MTADPVEAVLPGTASPSLAIPARENTWDQEDRAKILSSWELLKHLKGNNRLRAISYLSERDGKRCTLCNIVVHDVYVELQVDHIDGNRLNNRRWNLRLAHGSCNQHEYRTQSHPASSSLESVREKKSRLIGVGDDVSDVFPGWSSTPWNSREGEKHDVMRSRWNEWINDLGKGPFQAVGGFRRLRDLAEMAPRALGLGSSQTYRRYIAEDRFGPLEIYRDNGILFVRYRGIAKYVQKPDGQNES